MELIRDVRKYFRSEQII